MAIVVLDESTNHEAVYGDMSWEELQKILQEKESCVEHAVQSKQWKLAAQLEESL